MNILRRLWRDEQGFVVSAELVLVASVAVLAMIVGLATYRDAVIGELGDTAHAVGALNQSYQVTVGANGLNPDSAPAFTVAGDVVTVTRNYGDDGMGSPVVIVSSSFNNFSYTDAADFGDSCIVLRTSADGANEDTPPPTPIP